MRRVSGILRHMHEHSIPQRKEVPACDKWDLSTIYASDSDWEADLAQIAPATQELAALKGTLGGSSSALLKALRLQEKIFRLCDSVGNYASLSKATDEGDSSAQDKMGRYIMAATASETETAFLTPEMQAIPEKDILAWKDLPEFADYRIYIEKLLRLKPHILSEKEERILALQGEAAGTARRAFSMLQNCDLHFEDVEADGRRQPLTQTTWSLFMDNADRAVRADAYKKYYDGFKQHENVLSALYAGSVNQDIFEARARGYASSLEAALFPDKVPIAVYKNLIAAVRMNFAPLHRYYALRKKVLGVEELRHYDVYVPLVSSVRRITPYNEAVELVRAALAPLGTEYTDTLCDGLLNGWVDKYENKGKRGGAFSSGGYKGYPYILLNYKQDAIRDVFTMAHEGGHSMHSWYSVRSNPFMQYSYTIFEAEVASTFNEELLFRHLLKTADSAKMRAYLLSMRAGDILATLYRQTMFAEFELKCHELVEGGTPLSVDVLRETYGSLLRDYFGPEMRFEENSWLEGLRIPHFYNAFYVYKYATGISAALALAERVTQGGAQEKADYFAFLRSGGSRYPVESLRLAGVDMSGTAPVQSALDTFAQTVSQLEAALNGL